MLSARTADQLEQVAQGIEALGRRALVVPADLMDLDAVAGLADAAYDELGRLDIVVNNVGGTIPNALLDTDPELPRGGVPLQRLHRARADPGRRAADAEERRRLGRQHLLVMGRVTGRGYLAYGTAKAALAHYTRLAARDLARRIRVNAIAVGSRDDQRAGVRRQRRGDACTR